MFRGLFILIALIIVWFILKRWAKQALRDYIEKHLSDHKATVIEGGSMVRCERCGIYIAKADAIDKNGVYFCCKEHQS